MELVTKRLKLRPIQIEDKEAIFEYRSDAETNKYQGWIPESISDVEEFIRKISSEINKPETWFQMVIIEKDSGKITGDAGIHFYDPENKQAEIGCTINKDFQRKEYASEALTKILDYLFFNLNKHRVITSIDPLNFSSIKLVEKLGFKKEAHFRESLFIKGKWVDDMIFAKLAKEHKIS